MPYEESFSSRLSPPSQVGVPLKYPFILLSVVASSVMTPIVRIVVLTTGTMVWLWHVLMLRHRRCRLREIVAWWCSTRVVTSRVLLTRKVSFMPTSSRRPLVVSSWFCFTTTIVRRGVLEMLIMGWGIVVCAAVS